MQVKEAIHARRAIKHFDPAHKMTAADEKELLETTILAPTSFNIQHWRFVILRDPELRAKIRKDYGNDSCPMIGYDIEQVAKLIHLPADHVMGPMVAIGKGTKDAWPKPGQLTLDEVVIENDFGS
jgi:nitroreductase